MIIPPMDGSLMRAKKPMPATKPSVDRLCTEAEQHTAAHAEHTER